eukprot:5222912-Amphidinium_carterae.1
MKIKELEENLGMSMMRAQVSPLPVVNNIMNELLGAKGMLAQDPSTIVNKAFENVADLAKIQAGLTNGNAEYKGKCVEKHIFARQLEQLAEQK